MMTGWLVGAIELVTNSKSNEFYDLGNTIQKIPRRQNFGILDQILDVKKESLKTPFLSITVWI